MSVSDLLKDSDNYFKSLNKTFTKNKGIAYTPLWLTDHITSTAFTQWRKFNRGKKASLIGDLCCGTGIFIHSALNNISTLNWSTKIEAYDIDNNALSIAKKHFGNDIHLSTIEKKDVLLDTDDLFSQPNHKYDIIIGNPPYVNTSQIDDRYKETLKKNYACAKSGSFDLSIVFIEKILNSLNEGGVASIILSNKFMTTKYGDAICHILANNCNIIKIEDFNDIQLFPGLTTYTCILTFIKAKPAKKHTLVRYFGKIDKANPSLPERQEETITHDVISTHPWNFHSKEETSIHNKLNDKNNLYIGDIFNDIVQGVRTGANDVFILSDDTNYLRSDPLVIDYVSGENIKYFHLKTTTQKIIYPYNLSGQNLSQIPESTLKSEHKKLYSYLLEHKNTLEKRSLQGATKWYEYSRSQSLDSVFKRKIFVREMMPTAIFSADTTGQFAFSSGYALICNNMPPKRIVAWASILSTPIMEFAMRHKGTQLHSGWFRVMKNHLKEILLPRLSENDFIKIEKLASKESSLNELTSINDIVANSFKLTKDEVEYIHNYLSGIHDKSLPTNKRITKGEKNYEPVKLEHFNKIHVDRDDLRQEVTFSNNKKSPIHSWYKYTQGFSSNLVNTLLDEFDIDSNSTVLDPFNGCGTTTTACAYRGIDSIGIEISPLMSEIARIKARKWNLKKIKSSIDDIKKLISRKRTSNSFIFKDYFIKAYSPKILQKIIYTNNSILNISDKEVRDFYSIAFLSILEDISKIRKHGSHYRFLDNTSSVGLQKLNIQVIDENEDIVQILKSKMLDMYNDLCLTGGKPVGKTRILNTSSLTNEVTDGSIDCIITSPPYLNRNNYISQQKAELDVLKLISSKEDYKGLVKSTFRSHTDSNLDIQPRSRFKEINLILDNIQLENGNNPKIPHMICGYFDDLEMSLKSSYRVLKSHSKAAYVVGNTRWGGVVVPIDHLLSKIAIDIGFEIENIYVTRLKGNSPQQMKKYGKIPVRESIVILRKK